jgi:hypothetical protein
MHFWIHFATRAVLTALAALLVLSLTFPAVVVLADNLQPGIAGADMLKKCRKLQPGSAGVDILKKCRPKQPPPPPKP